MNNFYKKTFCVAHFVSHRIVFIVFMFFESEGLIMQLTKTKLKITTTALTYLLKKITKRKALKFLKIQ